MNPLENWSHGQADLSASYSEAAALDESNRAFDIKISHAKNDFKLVDLSDLGRQPAINATEPRGPKGNLVVVSNRVAVPREMRAGGLAIALKSALSEHGGIWFG